MSPSRSKFVTILGVIVAFVSVFADQTVAGAIAVIAGEALAAKVTAILTALGILAAALGRALLDADGDGTPDLLQGRR